MPWECKHSMARAISSAKLIATCMSKLPGRLLSIYLRNDPPVRISVTITIIGSLHAPINCLKKRWKLLVMFFNSWKWTPVNHQDQTFARFLCWTLDHVATSLTKRASRLAISSGVSPRWTILIATFWFLYLNNNTNEIKIQEKYWNYYNHYLLTFLHTLWHELLHQFLAQQKDVEDQSTTWDQIYNHQLKHNYLYLPSFFRKCKKYKVNTNPTNAVAYY